MACAGPADGALAQQSADPFAALKAKFVRPTFVPQPADNPPSPAKIALGKRLFEDKELSSTGTIACASCHDPKLSFSDGEPRGKGITGKRLVRHTPSLWNVAFSPLLFWDGRAASLEEQVRFPVEHPDEMGDTLDNAVHRFARHESYERDFAMAFPDDPSDLRAQHRARSGRPTSARSYPRRHASTEWVAGDADKLSPSEINGLKVFAGKGRCISCHTGFAFTDHNFYDIGLPGTDKGRGKEIDLRAADHAFKTPTLRELAWTAPYMHDGSLATLEDVIDHYQKGGVPRPTRSRDLPRNLKLTAAGAGGSHRLPRIPFQRGAAAAVRPKPGSDRVNRHPHRRPRTPLSSARPTSCSRRRTFAWAWGRRSRFSTTTRAPTTCASSIPGSISTPARRSPRRA